MNDLRYLIVTIAITTCLFSCSIVQASQSPTDMMSEALKQRSKGNITEAISRFKSAIEKTSNPMQRNLAKFMLGDCQLEAGHNRDAVNTFKELVETVELNEEIAEALYRLMQAESAVGNRKQAEKIFARIRKNHKSSPYYKLALSFLKSEKLRFDISSKDTKKLPPKKRKKKSTKQTTTHIKPSVATLQKTSPDEKKQNKQKDATTPKRRKPTKLIKLKKKTESVKATSYKPEKTHGKSNKIRLDKETTRLLNSLLIVEVSEENTKEKLVTTILSLQNQLKDGVDRPGMDTILLKLAGSTAEFGEFLEACKLYDQLLTSHPTSPLVEDAYYEAIRLRAVLGVHEAVIGWSKAFMAAFPTSIYRSKIRALVDYSQANGNVNLTTSVNTQINRKQKSSKAASKDSVNEVLKKDSEYIEASRKMKDGRYTLALVDFKRLANKYPEASQIWWELALVNVQMEDFKNAEKATRKMLSIDPNNEDSNSLLGYIHYRLENYEEAASAYDQAGESEGSGVNFFDAKNASERMKKSAKSR